MSYLNHYKCVKCGTEYRLPDSALRCEVCGHLLMAEYDLYRARRELYQKSFAAEATLWRYRHLLPPVSAGNELTLGEGHTPLIALKNMFEDATASYYLKNEAANPTGSIRDREMSIMTAALAENGLPGMVFRGTPNSCVAAGAYASLAGMPVSFLLPNTVPVQFLGELNTFSFEITLSKPDKQKREESEKSVLQKHPWPLITADATPFRVEGAKTLLFELWEQFNFRLPEMIIVPVGEGITLLGMWKGLVELQQLGWIQRPFPKIIGVESATRPRLFEAWQGLEPEEELAEDSIAVEMNAEKPVETEFLAEILREEDWQIVLADDDAILKTRKHFAQKQGIILSPEGSATVSTFLSVKEQFRNLNNPSVVFINPVSGSKYVQSIGFLKN